MRLPHWDDIGVLKLEWPHEYSSLFLVDSGEVVVPMDAYLVIAQKEG